MMSKNQNLQLLKTHFDKMNNKTKSSSEINLGRLRKCSVFIIALSATMMAELASAGNYIYNSSENISVATTYDLVYIGDNVSDVLLNITNPGSLTHTQDLVIGTVPGSNNNQIAVGAGAALSNSPPNTNTIYIGRSGNNNALLVQAGGIAESFNVRIGGGSSASGNPTGNNATIDGGTWNIGGTLRVGAGAPATTDTFSSLEIKAGGIATVSGDSFIGYSSTSTDNSILVYGLNSRLNLLKDLVIGGSSLVQTSVRNSATIADGGTLAVSGVTYIPSLNELYIASGGTLTAADMSSAGTVSVAPNSTATVNGNYVQFGGTFRTYVTSSSSFGRLHVLGDASISGGTVIDVNLANCSALTPGTTLYGIVYSSNPINFTPSTVTSNCQAVELSASLSPNSQSLNLVVGGVVPPPPPNPIPTLSELAQVMMMLAMIATAGFYGWRMKRL